MSGPDLDDDEDDAWARLDDDEDDAWPDLDDDEDDAWARPRRRRGRRVGQT